MQAALLPKITVLVRTYGNLETIATNFPNIWGAIFIIIPACVEMIF
jgi:hypothetical protein